MRNLCVAICFLCIGLSGCHFFGPRDLAPYNMITDRNELKDLNGVWKATGITYSMIKREKYKIDSVKLILGKDSTFEAVNLPDCLSDQFGEAVKHQLLSATGSWGVEKIGNEWKMSMEFNKGQLFKEKSTFDFDLYHSGKTILMSTYLGDPDEVKLLEFEKVK
jgi:hypothetical protein